MHFITGGAFNGKKAWVKKTYQFTQKDHWISAYANISLPLDLSNVRGDLLVIEGLEIWIKQLIKLYDSNCSLEKWRECLDVWDTWEKADTCRQLVVIGTDISKGIVPIEKEQRLWRDVTGWVYQDLAARSTQVEWIWYGLNQTIKTERRDENNEEYYTSEIL
ncbi:bifunctional adenosylcobinamide kinase/adenosylcobinamide-phosphate guanylyltransferase [Neobacillus sp. LXY-1]|uniref:bifunctional adenosylcobinamide kinase/adenosylcobinamide-phosphate guanylyltransferase n=1 Tax=Neobacillus sp. LXY-1 TaxID=3379133 RepID=UPI003EDF3E46